MIPRKPLKLTEGVLENRALHQSESSISVRWVAENLCDPSLNHGMVDGSWGFGCPLAGELRMTRLVPPPGAQLRAPEPSAHTHPVRKVNVNVNVNVNVITEAPRHLGAR